jgi:hypothetical protein
MPMRFLKKSFECITTVFSTIMNGGACQQCCSQNGVLFIWREWVKSAKEE